MKTVFTFCVGEKVLTWVETVFTQMGTLANFTIVVAHYPPIAYRNEVEGSCIRWIFTQVERFLPRWESFQLGWKSFHPGGDPRKNCNIQKIKMSCMGHSRIHFLTKIWWHEQKSFKHVWCLVTEWHIVYTLNALARGLRVVFKLQEALNFIIIYVLSVAFTLRYQARLWPCYVRNNGIEDMWNFDLFRRPWQDLEAWA